MKEKVLLMSHMPPPTTGIGSWTRRVLESGIPEYEIVFINTNTIGGRDPFKNTKIKIVDEIKRNNNIWKREKKALIENINCKIVHTNFPCTPLGMLRENICARIAHKQGRKFIVHCHCTVPNVENKWWKRAIFRWFSTKVDGYIVLNTASEQFIKKFYKKPVVILPNFLCESELSNRGGKIINNEIRNVLYVGGVSKGKGCDIIIEAARMLPNIIFHLVGSIESDILKIKDIPNNVTLYGNKDKEFVKEIMDMADIFLFLSHYFGEGFSVALVEAMGAGLPCIVSDWAANADMVGKEGGVVIRKPTAQSLISAINIISDVNIRSKNAIYNINKVKTHYISNVVLKELSCFYDEVNEYV